VCISGACISRTCTSRACISRECLIYESCAQDTGGENPCIDTQDVLKLLIVGDSSPTTQAVHPLLRRLPSRPPTIRPCSLRHVVLSCPFRQLYTLVRWCPVSGPRDAEMGTLRNHARTHGRDRITSLRSMLEMRPPLLERRSAARSLYMMPSPTSAVALLLS
jgi:hypothetical protein